MEEVLQKILLLYMVVTWEVFSVAYDSGFISKLYYSALHHRNTSTLQLRTVWNINQESG